MSTLQRVAVTGSSGLVGSALVSHLKSEGYTVQRLVRRKPVSPDEVSWDPKAGTIDLAGLEGIDAIIHLASVANDPCGDLDPKLTWEISALATMKLAEEAIRQGIKRFIYASSASVYGVKEEDQVTEDLALDPISEYNKTKMIAERVLLSYGADLTVQIVRPATVCGTSPRMRLDVSVNMLTMQALTNSRITVFGGDQVRPNIHIDDITDLYIFLLDHPEIVGVFNAGFENISIREIAERVVRIIPAEIVITPSNDPRSYRVNSDKLLATGFRPRKTVDDAISEIVAAFQRGTLKNEDRWHNLRWMQKEMAR